MDGLNVALHIVYHTNSADEAIYRAVNWGGDADSIAAITGCIVGALYGLDSKIIKLYKDEMLRFDNYSTFVKAYKLYNKKHVETPYKYTYP